VLFRSVLVIFVTHNLPLPRRAVKYNRRGKIEAKVREIVHLAGRQKATLKTLQAA
jgi:hypothetical protein